MHSLAETISVLSSDSLFSCIITLYTSLFLYSPCFFFPFVLFPVILATLILLLYLLRLGAAQSSAIERTESKSEQVLDFSEQIQDVNIVGRDEFNSLSNPWSGYPNRFYSEPFVEWDVRAPLDVIYELGEEGDEENDGLSEVLRREADMNVIRRYASLSLFYPESDSDSSSSSEGGFPADGDWNSPGNICFLWDWEDDEDDSKEGLIEIALNEKRSEDYDEDNLIEIDLSPMHGADFRQL